MNNKNDNFTLQIQNDLNKEIIQEINELKGLLKLKGDGTSECLIAILTNYINYVNGGLRNE